MAKKKTEAAYYVQGGQSGYHSTKAAALKEQAYLARHSGYPKSAFAITKKTIRHTAGGTQTEFVENPSPITARKSKSGVTVSVTVPSMAAAVKMAKKLGARVSNPGGSYSGVYYQLALDAARSPHGYHGFEAWFTAMGGERWVKEVQRDDPRVTKTWLKKIWKSVRSK